MTSSDPNAHDPLEALPVPQAASAGTGPADILVLDNDERIVELVSWFLGKRGFGVRRAHSFEEARAALADGLPDLMLSDLDLGAESALDELPVLAEQGLLPPTLVVSGYLDQDSTERLLAVPGVLGTLPKPFDFELLEARVLECLAARPAPVEAALTEEPAEASEHAQVERSSEGWVEIRPARPAASEAAAADAATPERGGGDSAGSEGAGSEGTGSEGAGGAGRPAPEMMRLHG
jgi:DNA-binding NtrC family response regulator